MTPDFPPMPAEAMNDAPFTDTEFDELVMSEDTDNPVARWQVTDERGAEWAMRKLAEAQAEITRRDLHLQGYLDEMREWHRRVTAQARRTADTMETKLAAYALAQRAEGRASVKLPSGTVKTNPTGGRPKVVDPVSVVEFLGEHLSKGELAVVAPPVTPTVMERELAKLVEIQTRPGYSCRSCSAFYTDRPEACECGCPEFEEGTAELVVLTATGHVVPGTTISPRGFNPSVKPVS